jgi:hypothetical protein
MRSVVIGDQCGDQGGDQCGDDDGDLPSLVDVDRSKRPAALHGWSRAFRIACVQDRVRR